MTASQLITPARFHALGPYLALLLMVVGFASCFSPPRHGNRWLSALRHPALFIGALTACLFYNRLPILLWPAELNPDESQMIAGALTLLRDPVFWRSVDGTTHGPFADLPLLLPALFGWAPGYLAARVVGLSLFTASLLAMTRVTTLLFGERGARLAVLPPALFLAYTSFSDFTHYSSEHAPVFFTSLTLWLLSEAVLGKASGRRQESWLLALSGALLWVIPLAKLQAAPLAAFCGVYAVWLLFAEAGRGWRWAIGRVGSLALGFFGFALLFALYLALFGLLEQFFLAYIRNNLAYAAARMPDAHKLLFVDFTEWWLLLYGLPFCLLCLPALWPMDAKRLRRVPLFFALCAVAVLTSLSPGRAFTHYLLFLVMPLGMLPGVLLTAVLNGVPPTAPGVRWITGALIATYALGVLLPWRVAYAYREDSSYLQQAANPPGPSAVSLKLRELARPGDRLAVWGWMCRYYAETGLPQGTRESHTERQLRGGAQQDWYRERYLADLQTVRPSFFVDAVAPKSFSFEQRDKEGHETFPALAAHIRDHYVQAAEVNGNRIYLRADLAETRLGRPSGEPAAPARP